MRGPVLMALTGTDDLALTPEALLANLREDAPLQARVEGIEGARYQPYWQIQGEPFTCFPTLRAAA
jgi:hypothetical protein